ncbi:MAG: aminotransferase class V-fold PLP-dependent enzyme [Microthrixaceae bacterium]
MARGKVVEEFEGLVAQMAGARHAVAVSSGTLSLVAALEALGVKPGDEVITSPFTFVASVNAALHVGARVRFADIDPATFTMDPAKLADVISDRTKVVMPVHLYGQMADLDGILKVIGDRDIAVLEDSAQAHGAATPTHRRLDTRLVLVLRDQERLDRRRWGGNHKRRRHRGSAKTASQPGDARSLPSTRSSATTTA